MAVLSAWACIGAVLAAARVTRSAEAGTEWPPERVRALVVEGASVRALRAADSRLNLLDAVTLVRSAG